MISHFPSSFLDKWNMNGGFRTLNLQIRQSPQRDYRPPHTHGLQDSPALSWMGLSFPSWNLTPASPAWEPGRAQPALQSGALYGGHETSPGYTAGTLLLREGLG